MNIVARKKPGGSEGPQPPSKYTLHCVVLREVFPLLEGKHINNEEKPLPTGHTNLNQENTECLDSSNLVTLYPIP